jgi:hypothetical protein
MKKAIADFGDTALSAFAKVGLRMASSGRSGKLLRTIQEVSRYRKQLVATAA